MRMFRVTLEAKGYLHFYATEYLKVTRVSDVLHNWALMLAINDVRSDPRRKHLENLRDAKFYCTPAVPVTAERRMYKRNPVPEDTGAGKMGLMEIEYYLPGSRFQFYVLSRDGAPPPDLIHYGKKRAPCRLYPGSTGGRWDDSAVPFRVFQEVAVRPEHIVNPLDYQDIRNVTYVKKIPMKPSPLYHLSATFERVLVADRVRVVVPNLEESSNWS